MLSFRNYQLEPLAYLKKNNRGWRKVACKLFPHFVHVKFWRKFRQYVICNLQQKPVTYTTVLKLEYMQLYAGGNVIFITLFCLAEHAR